MNKMFVLGLLMCVGAGMQAGSFDDLLKSKNVAELSLYASWLIANANWSRAYLSIKNPAEAMSVNAMDKIYQASKNDVVMLEQVAEQKFGKKSNVREAMRDTTSDRLHSGSDLTKLRNNLIALDDHYQKVVDKLSDIKGTKPLDYAMNL
jgi:hypothetical protein